MGGKTIRSGRRNFLTLASAIGATALLGQGRSASAEPPPETKKIRLVKIPAICLAPEYVAEDFLRSEGFSEVEFVEMVQITAPDMLQANRADVTVNSPPMLLPQLDAGQQQIALAGIHGGCYELFAHAKIRSVRDLRGKRVAIEVMGSSTEYFYLASMAAYVGMDPRKDIEWVEGGTFDGTMSLFVEGKADAFLAFPPQPQQLRAKKIGHVIINTAQDRPWSEYFCCLITARTRFVKENPIATKRACRAILKATDLCANEPERAARYIVAKGYEPSYDVALEVVKSLSYNRWRTYNVEDSLRFFGVRLHESGMIKSDPNKLIAQGTDWRFLNELKKELKA